MIEFKDDELVTLTKDYLNSKLGMYHMQLLTNKAAGFTQLAQNINTQSPQRYTDKASGIIEAINDIKAPLSDDMTVVQ